MKKLCFGGSALGIGLACAFFACVGSDPAGVGSEVTGTEGTVNQPCFANGTCHAGLICELGRCVVATSGTDGAVANDGAVSPDANDADAASFDADALPTVASIPGLALWLRADMGVTTYGSNVGKWDDQSGHANHAIPVGAVTGGATIGGKPALQFSDGPVGVAHSPSLQPVGADYLVAIVAKAQSNGTFYNYERLPPIPTGSEFFTRLGVINGNLSAQFFGGQPPSMEVLGTFNPLLKPAAHLYVYRRLASQHRLELRTDGTVAGIAAAPALANSLDFAGGQYSLKIGEQMIADIAEVVLIIGSAGVAQVGAVESYLLARYSL